MKRKWENSDATYLYTKKATEILTKQVVSTIEKALDIKSTAPILAKNTNKTQKF